MYIFVFRYTSTFHVLKPFWVAKACIMQVNSQEDNDQSECIPLYNMNFLNPFSLCIAQHFHLTWNLYQFPPLRLHFLNMHSISDPQISQLHSIPILPWVLSLLPSFVSPFIPSSLILLLPVPTNSDASWRSPSSWIFCSLSFSSNIPSGVWAFTVSSTSFLFFSRASSCFACVNIKYIHHNICTGW